MPEWFVTAACIVGSFFGGLLLAFALMPIVHATRKAFYWPWTRKKCLDEAVKRGHIVKVVCVDSQEYYGSYGTNDMRYNQRNTGVYRYQWMGKTYTRRLRASMELPKEIDMYFVKKPSNAVPEDQVGVTELAWGWDYLISAPIMMVLTYVEMYNVIQTEFAQYLIK